MFFFFFSSRRRHTRFDCDWSSDVCSSDLAEARRRFDYIVLDTPPLVSVPDCRVIGKWVDGFLIVVTAHRTSRKLLEEALKVTEPATILGLVFNVDDRHLSRHTYPSRRASARSDRRNSASND